MPAGLPRSIPEGAVCAVQPRAAADTSQLVAIDTRWHSGGEPMQTETFSHAIERLDRRGFTHTLRAEGGRLHDLLTGEFFDPALLAIAEVVRFEGESDPDEQAILFALLSPEGGALGTYSAVFGPSTPPEDGDVVRRLGAKG